MTQRGLSPRRLASPIAASRLSASRLKVSGRTSTKTGVAPASTATSTVATKVKAGTNTASPVPMPSAIRASNSASVPLAQVMQCRAPQKAASCALELGNLGPKNVLAMFEHR